MKSLLWIFIPAIFLLDCQPVKQDLWTKNGSFQQWCQTVFQSDSGSINLQQLRQLEIFICQTDASIFPPAYCNIYTDDEIKLIQPNGVKESSDSTGGKYFRVTTNGVTRWILYTYLHLGWETPYVFEFQQNQAGFTITSWAYYPHGNWACCWDGPMSGLYHVGPYFLIETCGTGSGFCSGEAHVLFFPLRQLSDSIPNLPGIPVSMFQNFILRESLRSKLALHGDTIVASYEYQVDSLIVTDQERDTTIPLDHYRFQALFKVDNAKREVELLNRDSVMQYEELSWMFEEFK